MYRSTILAGLALALVSSPASAEDWPRFRGPNGSGISESAVPVEFGFDSNMKWKKKLPGRGVSSPIVVGDRVFVTCYSGYGVPGGSDKIEDLKRHLVCLNKKTGEELWSKTVPAKLPEDPYSGIGVPAHGYASHTPTSDGERVYAFFGKGGVIAFDLDGKKLWEKVVGTESGPQRWGSAASPIVYEELLIVNASDESEAVVGLDKKTGEEKWRAEAGGLASVWGTPVLVESATGPEVVLAVPNEIWGLDAKTGKLKWYGPGPQDRSVSHSLIEVDGAVVSIGGRGGNALALKTGGKGDVGDDAVLWKTTASGRFASPVRHGKLIFAVSGGVVSAYDSSTGERVQQARIPGASSGGGGGRGPGRRPGGENPGEVQTSMQPQQRGFGGGRQRGGPGGGDYASPVVAGGKLYVTMKSGKVHVYEATAELKHLATNDLSADTSGFDGTPAISDGCIYLRSNTHLYCFGK